MTAIPSPSESKAEALYRALTPPVEKHLATTRITQRSMHHSPVGKVAKDFIRVLENHLDALKRYRENNDVEALRCCSKDIYSGHDDTIALHEAIEMMRALGHRAVSRKVTQRHIQAVLSIHAAVSSVRTPTSRVRFSGSSPDEKRLVLLAYRDMTKLPVIISLIEDRKLTDPSQIEALLDERDNLAPSLTTGAL